MMPCNSLSLSLSLFSILHCPDPVPQSADDQRPYQPLSYSQRNSVVRTNDMFFSALLCFIVILFYFIFHTGSNFLQASRFRAADPEAMDRGEPSGGAVSGHGLGSCFYTAGHRLHRGFVQSGKILIVYFISHEKCVIGVVQENLSLSNWFYPSTGLPSCGSLCCLPQEGLPQPHRSCFNPGSLLF